MDCRKFCDDGRREKAKALLNAATIWRVEITTLTWWTVVERKKGMTLMVDGERMWGV